MARTTVDIDEELLEKALAVSEARTKKGVIEESLREYVRHRALEHLRGMLGSLDLDLTHEQLMRMREAG
ncbi:MAG: type II toxin-antitoxin system VapB family antitoxin [Dehalococcoidia bacterium]